MIPTPNADRSLALSIVICSYNRVPLLRGVLADLCAQSTTCTDFEIIVVDNGSEDDTRQVVETLAKSHSRLRYGFEPELGLSYARNRGIAEAEGAYIAYIDDDCRVPRHWTEIALGICRSISPGVFGGPYKPWYDSPRPAWWRDDYGAYRLGEQPHPISPREYLSGGNIVFRRDLLDAIGGFDRRLGMHGRRMGYGEETEAIQRIRSEFPNEIIYYDPRLEVEHLVSADKMRLWWQLRMNFIHGVSVYRIFGPSDPQNGRPKLLARMAREMSALIFHMAKAHVARDRSAHRHAANYIFEHCIPDLVRLGRLYEEYRYRMGSAGGR